MGNQDDGFPRENNNNNYNNNFPDSNCNNNNNYYNHNYPSLGGNDDNNFNPYSDGNDNNNNNNYNNNNFNFNNNNSLSFNNYSDYNSNPMILYDIWKSKVNTYNEYIDEGKFSYHAIKLKEGMHEILDGIPLIDRVIKDCMSNGDNEGRHNLLNIKCDMEQTCYRYECLMKDKKLEPFQSASEGNSRRYFFNKNKLFEEKEYVPFNNTEKENKFVSGLEKFGHSLKDGAFFVGRAIKNTTVSGYNYVKEKISDEPSNSNNDNNNESSTYRENRSNISKSYYNENNFNNNSNNNSNNEKSSRSFGDYFGFGHNSKNSNNNNNNNNYGNDNNSNNNNSGGF